MLLTRVAKFVIVGAFRYAGNGLGVEIVTRLDVTSMKWG